MRNKNGLMSWLVIGGMVLCAIGVSADIKGRLIVSIDSKDKKPIEGVLITLQAVEFDTMKYEITTDEDGKAMINGVDPIEYKIKATKEGYQDLEGKVKLRAGVKVKQDWTMLTIEEAKEAHKEQVLAGMTEEEKNKLFAKDEHNQGIKAYEAGDVAAAETHLKKAIELDPAVSYLDYLLLGQFAFNAHKVDETITYLTKAKELDTEGASKLDIHRLLGASYMIKQDYANAKAVWSDLVKDVPDATVLFNLANIDIKDKKFAEAIQWLEICREKNPEYGDGLALLGDLYIQEQNMTKALEVYQQYQAVLEKNPQANPEQLKNAKDTVKLLKEQAKKGK